MNVLLDTCVFLWIVRGDSALSPIAKATFSDRGNIVYLSAVSVWEIVVKNRLGRLPLAQPAEIYVPKEREKHRILPLDLTESAVLVLKRLPDLHADPFDRMLVCQAIAHGMVLLTPDAQIQAYPVNSRW